MNRFFVKYSIELCLVLALAATSSLRGEDALPSQEQALARALENHPEIVAAKAKVGLANAELYGKRIEVSRQILGLFGELRRLDAEMNSVKSILNRKRQSVEKGGATDQATQEKLAAETYAAEAQLVKQIGEREQVEKELRLLVGKAAPPASGDAAGKVGPTAEAVAARQQMPKGPVVDKIKVALDKPLKLQCDEMPLGEFLSHLTNNVDISFSLQRAALESAGIASDHPITLHTAEVPLHAVIEAFQDAYPDLQCVSRDYGVLVTSKGYAEEHGYMPVLELEKVGTGGDGIKAR